MNFSSLKDRGLGLPVIQCLTTIANIFHSAFMNIQDGCASPLPINMFYLEWHSHIPFSIDQCLKVRGQVHGKLIWHKIHPWNIIYVRVPDALSFIFY